MVTNDIVTLWSAKGGAGTTVTACMMALNEATRRNTIIVDLCGDVPATLGMAQPDGPGVFDWLASPDAGDGALGRLLIDVDDNLRLLPMGWAHCRPVHIRWGELIDALSDFDCKVVIDAGVMPNIELLNATHSVLVTRACYLALRRAVQAPQPDAIILLEEVGRALNDGDIQRALNAPVALKVPVTADTARSVDAGLMLAHRRAYAAVSL